MILWPVMSTIAVTTWSLEQTAPADLRPAAAPAADVRIVRAEVPSPEFSRFLYTSVGGDIRWTDRLGWTYAQWQEHLERPGVETWVAYERGTPAGYVELDAAGRRGGGDRLLRAAARPSGAGASAGTCCPTATARAWDLAERWPGRAPTKRVWLHTCCQDGPHAMDNYQRRGFRSSTRRSRRRRTWPLRAVARGVDPA